METLLFCYFAVFAVLFNNFQAECWKSCINISFELTEVKRQTDREFIKILQYVRLGK